MSRAAGRVNRQAFAAAAADGIFRDFAANYGRGPEAGPAPSVPRKSAGRSRIFSACCPDASCSHSPLRRPPPLSPFPPWRRRPSLTRPTPSTRRRRPAGRSWSKSTPPGARPARRRSRFSRNWKKRRCTRICSSCTSISIRRRTRSGVSARACRARSSPSRAARRRAGLSATPTRTSIAALLAKAV